jgi:protein SCO1/2
MRRTLIISAGVAVVAAGLAAATIVPRLAAPTGPAIGGGFSLTDDAGHRVTQASYQGQWVLIYFGYTHCPDACPTTLSDIAAGLDKLPPEKRRHIRVLFVTVDPGRDTPSVMHDYVHAFGPEFTGLTGTQAELDTVEQSFHVYAQRHALKGGDYAMDHSSIIYVMNPGGDFTGLIDDSLSPAQIAGKLVGFGA